MQQDGDEKAIGLNVSEILTLRFLYRSRRLQQRDQSYAPNDSYNQIISYCYHDITKLSVDAVVNGANRAMKVTGGETLNNAIHRAAGPALARETKTKGRIRNQAVLTGGYRLPSKHVIHVLRPGYSSSKGMRQFNQLIDCYRNAFKVAIEHQLKTIAFPCLGTGGVGFPARVAARIILQEVREYLDGHPQHGLERIIFCVNTAADEKAYVDFLPVYFPPTHDDLETARFSVWSEDRAAVVDQVLDARNEIHKVSWELGIGFSQSVPNFTQDILDHISVIDLALASIRRFLLWSNELNQALRDLKLVCSVMQLFCGNITEIVELAKDHTKLGQSNDESIWDDYVADSNKRHGRGPSELLKDCRKFAENLDSMITRKGVEMDEIMGMVDIRQKLEHYKVKQRGGFDAEGTQDHLNEVLYTREFQRETIAQSRDTVKIHQIPSIAQLYKLGELEEKPTLAHPSTPFNDKICLVREDITKLEVDVMVNSTDAAFEGIGTLARTVFLKGGVQLREAVRIVGECKAGDVKLTEGYLLPAKHVLHVVPPDQFRAETKDIMRKIYREVLHTAVTLRATSVAFPCIGKPQVSIDFLIVALTSLRYRFAELPRASVRIPSLGRGQALLRVGSTRQLDREDCICGVLLQRRIRLQKPYTGILSSAICWAWPNTICVSHKAGHRCFCSFDFIRNAASDVIWVYWRSLPVSTSRKVI
jgi:O-acetyl-ADP-ribose deacetylase (regulator of RNase III)